MNQKAELVVHEKPRERADSAESASVKPRWPRAMVFLPALLTGGLWWASHFPLNWSWLAWVALVPLLALVRSPARPRRIYLAAWLCGLVFYLAATQWMRYADDSRMVLMWGGLATYCSLYVPLTIFLVRRLEARTRWPLTLTFPLVWTALEYLRAHFGTGFPWYFLAHTQHAQLWLIQISDLGGAYGVSFLVAAVNALAFEWLSTLPRFRTLFTLPDRTLSPGHPLTTLPIQTAGVLTLLVGTNVYGLYRLQQGGFEPGPRLALVQPSIEQRVRNEIADPNAKTRKPVEQEYTELHEKAVEEKPHLIVWPETSFWDEWWEPAPALRFENLPEEYQKAFGNDATPIADGAWRRQLTAGLNKAPLEYFRKWPVPVLFGMNSRIKMDLKNGREGKHFNSAILFRDEGEENWFARYDKIHRVPFGEYIPFRDWIPAMNKLSPYENLDYSVIAGDKFTRFQIGKHYFGVLICFEDTDPYLSRQYLKQGAEEGPPVDFLVNISNDGWFDGSAANDEHLLISRFRAIECRRSLARSANMGISAIIDGNGRIVKMPADTWEASKKLSTQLAGNIPIDRRGSLYVLWGDWFPAGCWVLVGAGILFGNVFRRRGGLWQTV